MSWEVVAVILLYVFWLVVLLMSYKRKFERFEWEQDKQLKEFETRVSSHIDMRVSEALKKMHKDNV